ncbi:putative membrane protein [Nitrosospira multiformis]|uniref:Putative membrane protein n=2 Tax=Nitrosospira multiformis TaxID=1231 RepID=A0A2T5I7W0_9PROT|nr:putative membrane protein [Nitrosospira multiformis]
MIALGTLLFGSLLLAAPYLIEEGAINPASENLREGKSDPEKMSDPRVFFAAERTLLAWVRTGLTIIALGFVVARFGLFLNLLVASGEISKNGGAASAHGISGVFGIILVLSGTVTILGALLNHRHYVSSLPLEDLPRLSLPWLSSFLSLSVATIGFLLAVYLLFT